MSLPSRGVGAFDTAVLERGSQRSGRIEAELTRLERAHVQLLIDALRPMRRDERVLHVGRSVEAVAALAEHLDCAVDTAVLEQAPPDLDDGVFDAVVDSEIHRRTDLFKYCAQLSRVLRPRGRFTFTTWCVPDDVPPDNRHIQALDRQTRVVAQPWSRYFAALTSNGFVPYQVIDLTRQAIPYWRLRLESARRSGIEAAFLAAYTNRAAGLVLVAAERFNAMPRAVSPASATVALPPPPAVRSAFGLAYD